MATAKCDPPRPDAQAIIEEVGAIRFCRDQIGECLPEAGVRAMRWLLPFAAASFRSPSVDGLDLLKASLNPCLAFVRGGKPLEVVVAGIVSRHRRRCGPRPPPFGGYYLIWLCPTCLKWSREHVIS